MKFEILVNQLFGEADETGQHRNSQSVYRQVVEDVNLQAVISAVNLPRKPQSVETLLGVSERERK